jgi:hypothetical protein
MNPDTRNADLSRIPTPESDAQPVEGRTEQTAEGWQRAPDHPNIVERTNAAKLGITLDWLAVGVAVLLAILVYAGLLPSIPW